MTTEQVSSEASWAARAAGAAHAHHPLSPLTSTEIKASTEIIKGVYLEGAELLFKQITLIEPKKSELAPWLDAQHEGKQVQLLDRKSSVTYYLRNTVCLARVDA
jgi:Cu2+-containing amine oxidase